MNGKEYIVPRVRLRQVEPAELLQDSNELKLSNRTSHSFQLSKDSEFEAEDEEADAWE
ncbi:MAG: hypothetical protein SOY06_05235 [Prevotella sp.]|nr:hypothetical protein [Bacteroidales bacterium]MDY4229231.1 hypothetical protein [Prevotella sp.]